MDIITKEVVSQGQVPPLFHIFSQTKEECPSEETGAFAEFPKWPLDPEEVCDVCMSRAKNVSNA